MARTLKVFIMLLVLAGCQVTVPLLAITYTASEFAAAYQDLQVRVKQIEKEHHANHMFYSTCKNGEDDLLPEARKAIAKNDVDKYIQIYHDISQDDSKPKFERAHALYQQAMLYLHGKKDNDKFHQTMRQIDMHFPGTHACLDHEAIK